MTRTSTASQRSIFASVATITTLMKLLVGSVALLFVITANATILGTTGSSPIGIAIDADGNVYTANTNSNDVSKITPDGTSTIFGTTGDSPQFLVLDADSNVYITNRGSDNVSKITPAAPAPASTATPVPVGPLWLLGIMAGLLSLVGMSKFHKT